LPKFNYFVRIFKSVPILSVVYYTLTLIVEYPDSFEPLDTPLILFIALSDELINISRIFPV